MVEKMRAAAKEFAQGEFVKIYKSIIGTLILIFVMMAAFYAKDMSSQLRLLNENYQETKIVVALNGRDIDALKDDHKEACKRISDLEARHNKL